MASSRIPERLFFESIYSVLKVDETLRPVFQQSAEEIAQKFAPANELQAYNIDFRAENLALQFIIYHGIGLLGFPTNSLQHLSKTEASGILKALESLFGWLLETSVAARGIDLAASGTGNGNHDIDAITKSMKGTKLDGSEEVFAQKDPEKNIYIMEEAEDLPESVQRNGGHRAERGLDNESRNDGTAAQDPEDKTNEVLHGESDESVGRLIQDDDDEPEGEKDDGRDHTVLSQESKHGDGQSGTDEGNSGSDIGVAVDKDQDQDQDEDEDDKECPFLCGAFFSDYTDLQDHVDEKHPPEDSE